MKEDYTYAIGRRLSDIQDSDYAAMELDAIPDADACSSLLYSDLADAYNALAAKNGLSMRFVPSDASPCELLLLSDDHGGAVRLGSDFIGASRYWSQKIMPRDAVIKCYLRSRILGGHIIFPRHIESINQAKGGRPLYDRIDVALHVIRKCYLFDFDRDKVLAGLSEEGGDQAICQSKRLVASILKAEDWFRLFGSWQKYVAANALQDFVDADEPYLLDDSSHGWWRRKQPFGPEYPDRVARAIANRTLRMISA